MEKKTTRKNRSGFSKYVVSMLLFLLFEAVAITLWLTKNNLFYLLNFSYIGCCLSLGTALFTAGKRYARHFVQLAVGAICCFTSACFPGRICRLRGSGIICFSVLLKRRLSIMQWRRSLVRCCSDGAGAVTPAGQPWCWIFCHTSSRRSHERKSWGFCVM